MNWTSDAVDRVFCRNGTKFCINWKTEAVAISSSQNTMKVTVQVAWKQPVKMGSYKPGTSAPCMYYETSAIKTCNLGDTAWGCP
jgi:hypothetical protein